MARRTRQEAQETRQRIMDAAIDVFFENGVAATTLNAVATRAQVTRGAIYWHFRNKYDLYDALYEQFHLSIAEIILRDLENDHPHPLLQLERLCTELLLDLERSEQRRFKVLSILYLKTDYSGDMAIYLQRQNTKRQHSTDLFARYFSRARERNALPMDIEPRTLSVALMAYMTGLVHEYLRDPGSINMSKMASRFTRLFFRNLG